MSPATIEAKTKEYKLEVRSLEQSVHYSEDAKVRQVSLAAEKCMDTFNDLQMSIVKIRVSDPDRYKKYQRLCYDTTCEFISFVENKVDLHYCTLLLNKSRPFADLINHYSMYCTKIEKEFSIKLAAEETWGNNIKAMETIKKYLKHA